MENGQLECSFDSGIFIRYTFDIFTVPVFYGSFDFGIFPTFDFAKRSD